MNKELTQRYLKLKHEISQYNTKLADCNNIIEEFNLFLADLAKRCSDNKYDIWAIGYYGEKFAKLALQQSSQGKIDYSTKRTIEKLKSTLRDLEKVASTATKEESRAYCAGPFNVGFHHYDVPDYDARRKAKAEIEKVKDELEKYKDCESSLLLEDNLIWAYNNEKEYRQKVSSFNADKGSYISSLHTKYIEVLSIFNILTELQEDYERLNQELNNLTFINQDFEKIDISKPELTQLQQSLLDTAIKYLDASFILDSQHASHKDTSNRLIAKMIKRHYTSTIMPKFTRKLKQWDYFMEQISFPYTQNKRIKINSGGWCDRENAVIEIMKEFDENGYAILKMKTENSYTYKFMAVDIMGNIYDTENENSNINVNPQVLSILDILYDKKSINLIDKSFFKDKKFVDCLNFYLERKYLYQHGLVDEDKKYLLKVDKQIISSLRDTTKELSKQAKLCKTDGVKDLQL